MHDISLENLLQVFVGLLRVYLNFAAEGLIKSQSVYIFKTFKIYTLITRVVVAVDVEDEDNFMFFVSIFFVFDNYNIKMNKTTNFRHDCDKRNKKGDALKYFTFQKYQKLLF